MTFPYKYQRGEAVQKEPKPVGNGDIVWIEVVKDLKVRAAFGFKKYGTELKTNNGRNALVDAYQEQIDGLLYTKQLILEREEEGEILCQVYALLAELKLQDEANIALSVGLLRQILERRNVLNVE